MQQPSLKTTPTAFLIVLGHNPEAKAAENKYKVTLAEQAACGPYAISLCGKAGEDEDKILACMKANRASMTGTCRTVFEEGLRRRGL